VAYWQSITAKASHMFHQHNYTLLNIPLTAKAATENRIPNTEP